MSVSASQAGNPYSELTQSVWFSILDETRQRALFSVCRPIRLVAREYLFHRGDTFNGIFVLLEGALWISGLDNDGNEVGLTVIKPGEWFGEIALFDKEPRTHDVLASEPCRLLHVPAEKLYGLLASDAQWWPLFGQLLTAKVRMLFQSIEDRSQPRTAVRVARKLYEFVLRSPSDSTHTEINMGQEQFGKLLSLSRQKTNQHLKLLASQGVIAVSYGKITILSNSKLKVCAQIND